MTAPIRLKQRKNSDGINLVVGMETSPAIICVLPGVGWQAWCRLDVYREAQASELGTGGGWGGTSPLPAPRWALHLLSCLASPAQPGGGVAEATGRAEQRGLGSRNDENNPWAEASRLLLEWKPPRAGPQSIQPCTERVNTKWKNGWIQFQEH